MTWGTKGQDALWISYQKTGVVPPALEQKPVFTPDLLFYIEAFFYLSSFRGSNGFGANPLALQDILSYCALIGYTSEDDVLFFSEVMRACDHVFLEEQQKQSKAKEKQPSSQAGKVSAFSKKAG